MSHRKLAINFIIMFFLCSQAAYGQAESREFKRGVATVIFSSLGGAVLGLSTLSFYSKPQNHVSNIPLGALLGFIAGSGYLLYSASQEPETVPQVYEEYGYSWELQKTRGAWHSQAPLYVQFSFEF